MKKKQAFVRALTLMALTTLTALTACTDQYDGTDTGSSPALTPGQLGIAHITLDGSGNAADTRIAFAPNTPITALTEGDKMEVRYNFAGKKTRGVNFNVPATSKYAGYAIATNDGNGLYWKMSTSNNPLRPNAPGNTSADDNETWAGAQATLFALRQPTPPSGGLWGDNMTNKISSSSGMPCYESAEADVTIPGNTGTDAKKLRAYYDALTASTAFPAPVASGASEGSASSSTLTPGIATIDRTQDSPTLGAICANLAHTGALLSLKAADIKVPTGNVFVHNGRTYTYSDFTALWAEISVATVTTAAANDGSGGSTNNSGSIATTENKSTFYVLLTPAATGTDGSTTEWQAITPGSVRTGITENDADGTKPVPARIPGGSLVSISASVTGFAARINATTTDDSGNNSTASLYFVLELTNGGDGTTPSKSLGANLRYDLKLTLSPQQSTVSFLTPAGKPGWEDAADETELANWDKHLSVTFKGGDSGDATKGTYTYTVKTPKGLKAVADWMNNGGRPPAQLSGTPDFKGNNPDTDKNIIVARMRTNITLANDLDFATLPILESGGNNWAPLGKYVNDESYCYTGTFDGNGYTIKGLVCYTTATETDNTGFFGVINQSAVVKNLTLEDAIISSTGNNTGGFVGYAKAGTVTNCHFRATTPGKGTVTSSGTRTGGIVGISDDATISACSNSGTVTGSGSNAQVGGVVGYNSPSPLIACYSTGEVIGSGSGAKVGGVTGGSSHSSVTACYSTGKVTGSENSTQIGGVIGDNISVTLTTCYWQKGTGAPDNGSGNTDDAASVEGIEFNSSWNDALKALNASIATWNANNASMPTKQCPYSFKENSGDSSYSQGQIGGTPLILELTVN